MTGPPAIVGNPKKPAAAVDPSGQSSKRHRVLIVNPISRHLARPGEHQYLRRKDAAYYVRERRADWVPGSNESQIRLNMAHDANRDVEKQIKTTFDGIKDLFAFSLGRSGGYTAMMAERKLPLQTQGANLRSANARRRQPKA